MLIAGSFYLVWRRTEKLVYEKDRTTARLLYDPIMLKFHWERWETEKNTPYLELVKELSSDLQEQQYHWKFIGREKTAWTDLPADEWEEKMLAEIESELAIQSAEETKRIAAQDKENGSPNTGAGGQVGKERDTGIAKIYKERPRSETPGEYHYYQPVYWIERCISCHPAISIGAVSAAESGAFSSISTHLRSRLARNLARDGRLQSNRRRRAAVKEPTTP